MNRTEWIGKLARVSSPFVSVAATDPWADRIAHVQEINGESLDQVLGLIERQRAFPHDKLGCLLVGQAGSGRSHLLQNLCHHVAPDVANFAFAAIQPIKNGSLPLSHLLREIVSNLIQRPPADRSTTLLERIVGKCIARFLREVYEKKAGPNRTLALSLADAAERGRLRLADSPDVLERFSRQVRRWLADRAPGMWDDFLRVIFQYLDPRRRQLVVNWIRGDGLADDDEYRALGLRPRSPDIEASEKEEFASRCLTTLGRLLEHDRPLVVCFDQLEEVFRKDLTAALDQMVFHLFERMPFAIVLLSLRGDDLKLYRRSSDEAVQHRLASGLVELRALDEDRALRLVRARLQTLDLPADAPDLFPFDQEPERSRILEAVGGSHSPRQILQKAHRIWLERFSSVARRPRAEPRQTVAELLSRWIEGRRKEILDDLDRWGPNSDVLAEALELRFRYPPTGWDFEVARVKVASTGARSADLVVQVREPGRERSVGFLVDVERHHLSVGATFRNGQKLRDAGTVNGLVFLRDGRVPFPDRSRWPKTNELKTAFVKRGGLLLEPLTTDEVATYVALVHLHQAILAEDVSCEGPDGLSHRVAIPEFEQFVRTRFELPRQVEVLAYCRDEPAVRRARRGDGSR